MKAKDLLQALVNSSEKAANIARKCRSNHHLFSLLIEEKTGEEKNERFFQDFKTLADCLIQEVIRYDVGKLFPTIKDNIKGEESNKFENKLGEKIIIEVNENHEATYETLKTVLDGNVEAAMELTNEIYRTIVTEESQEIESTPVDIEIDFDVGIWIDPIDGTAEYINGVEKSSQYPNIQSSGLQCATVLIGAYNKATGHPFIGIVCSPFASKASNESYSSKIYFGLSLDDIKYSNVDTHKMQRNEKKIAITSSSEVYKENISFDIVTSAGAGYKALKVIEGSADVYYLSKASTFKWDTCSCQAILMSLGGDMVEMKNSIIEKRPISLTYSGDDDKCNRNGLIAYRNINDFRRLVNDLSDIYN